MLGISVEVGPPEDSCSSCPRRPSDLPQKALQQKSDADDMIQKTPRGHGQQPTSCRAEVWAVALIYFLNVNIGH